METICFSHIVSPTLVHEIKEESKRMGSVTRFGTDVLSFFNVFFMTYPG